MYHPWYNCFQIIRDFSPKKGIDQIVYINSLISKVTENTIYLYGGDTEGNIHYFKQNAWKNDSPFILEKTISSFHKLTIINILIVQKDNVVFTIGYDQKIQGFDETSGKQIFNHSNPHKCLFTDLVWDSEHQVIIVF